MSSEPSVPKPVASLEAIPAGADGVSAVSPTEPKGDSFDTPASQSPSPERVAQAKAVAIEAGQRITQDFAELGRRERLSLVSAFRLQLIPPRKPGRRRSKEITAAHADWKSGLRGLALYQRHIPGLDRMSHWKRRVKMEALREAIRSRERRALDRRVASQNRGEHDRRNEQRG